MYLLVTYDSSNHQNFIGKLTIPNINIKALVLSSSDPSIIKDNTKIKIGCLTINDHLSFLDKHEDIKFKVKLEKTNDSLEDIELNMMLGLQTHLNDLIIDYIFRKKSKLR